MRLGLEGFTPTTDVEYAVKPLSSNCDLRVSYFAHTALPNANCGGHGDGRFDGEYVSASR